jgi:biotin-dependent carboxylase-like uncharacterized protein
MTPRVEVVRSGPLTSVQDLGRFGHRRDGVSPSGAADLGAMARANLLVGNAPGEAVLEATFGHLALRAVDAVTIAVTGADCPGVRMNAVVRLAAGRTLDLGAASAGVRAYVAVAGGIAVPAVLGSRSTDTLSGLGPAPLRDGQVLDIGSTPIRDGSKLHPATPPPDPPAGGVALNLIRGPHDDWLPIPAWSTLAERRWEVSPESNRVAVRLRGPALAIRDAALPPEPLVRGAVQVPRDGMPIIFLADHPVTGGYPVVGVLTPGSCDALAQCRPGSTVSLRAAAAVSAPT